MVVYESFFEPGPGPSNDFIVLGATKGTRRAIEEFARARLSCFILGHAYDDVGLDLLLNRGSFKYFSISEEEYEDYVGKTKGRK